MTRIRSVVVVLALLTCMIGFAEAGDLSGHWRGTMNGEPVELQLGADGSGSFNGAALTW